MNPPAQSWRYWPPPTGARSATEPGLVDWSRWSVILLKPDCLHRGLVGEILEQIAGQVELRAAHTLTATERQIFTHYADMLALSAQLGVDIAAELRRIYLGHPVVIALGHGLHAVTRLRELIGPTDPVAAAPGTIRGRYGIDSLERGRAEHRLIDNLIHTSDDSTAARRDFSLWFGGRLDLLVVSERRTQP